MSGIYEIEKQCFKYLSAITVTSNNDDPKDTYKNEQSIRDMQQYS
jgi:hypothetical protein